MISIARTLRRTTAALALTMLLGACSDATGPGQIAVPDVAGNWFGTFGDAPVSLRLAQSGDEITGTFASPKTTYPVTADPGPPRRPAAALASRGSAPV